MEGDGTGRGKFEGLRGGARRNNSGERAYKFIEIYMYCIDFPFIFTDMFCPV